MTSGTWMKYNELLKVKLRPNDKRPLEKGWQNKTIMKIEKGFNVGLITGKKNNLIVIDIDKKDRGLEELEKYIKKHGEIITVIQKSPNDGLHLMFTYDHSDKECAFLIEKYLKNKSKYRGKGIDARSNGGYIVVSPSTIGEKKYEFVNSFDDVKVAEIPKSFLYFLLEFELEKKSIKKMKEEGIKNEDKTKPNSDINVEYIIQVTKKEVKEVLKLLSKEYKNNLDEWFKVLTVCKNVNMWDVLDEYSKTGKGYNKESNMNIWNNNKGKIDINYLVFVINSLGKKKIRYFEKYKKNMELIVNEKIKKITMDNKYVFDKDYNKEQFDYKVFKKYATIILESGTGTGKTFSVFNHIKKYFDEVLKLNNIKKKSTKKKSIKKKKKSNILECIKILKKNVELSKKTKKIEECNPKLITIVCLRTLAAQHCINAKEVNLELESYRDKPNIMEDNITICVNSLMMLSELPIEKIKNTILYIDEISSFIDNIVNNSTLNKNLKNIFAILTKLIMNAKKVIVSDANINNAVFELLDRRKNSEKIYIKNKYLKYNGLKATRMYDKNDFLEKMIKRCKNKDYFFFGSDSATIVRQYFYKCKDEVDEDIHKDMILITAEDKFELEDANIQFANKFVFFSPSIIYGVDYVSKIKQDVFLYIGGTSINVACNWQQMSRCRNIKNMYFLSEARRREAKYTSLEDVKNKLKTFVKNYSDSIGIMCNDYDENGELKFNENLFFKLACHVEYQNDIYKTNPVEKFKEILRMNKVEIIDAKENDIIELEEETMNEMIELVKDKDEELFEEYINTENKEDPKYETMNKRAKMLKISENKKLLNEYKEYVINKKKMNTHVGIDRLLKTEKYVKSKIKDFEKNNFTIKLKENVYMKIDVLFQIEECVKMKKHYDFDFLEKKIIEEEKTKSTSKKSKSESKKNKSAGKKTESTNKKSKSDDTKKSKGMISCKLYELIESTYGTTQENPSNYREFRQLYISMIKNIADKDFIKSKRSWKGNKNGEYIYSLNKDKIKEHIKLDKYANPYLKNYNEELLKRLDIKLPVRDEDIDLENLLDD